MASAQPNVSLTRQLTLDDWEKTLSERRPEAEQAPGQRASTAVTRPALTMKGHDTQPRRRGG